MMDEDRRKMLDEALEHLNQAAALLGKVNITEQPNYSCPVIGVMYDVVDSTGIIEVQLGIDYPNDLMKDAIRIDRDETSDDLTLRKGNLEIFKIVPKERSDQ